MHFFKEVKRAVAADPDFRVDKQNTRKVLAALFSSVLNTQLQLCLCEVHVRLQLIIRL